MTERTDHTKTEASRRRPRNTRTLVLGGSGLALAAAVLVSSALGGGTEQPARHSAPATAEQTNDTIHSRAAEREQCDGRDAAASYRPSSDTGPAVQRIQDRKGGKGQLIVGVDQNSYLWGFRAPESGEIVGFDIDLIEAIATDLLGPDPDILYRAIPTAQRIPLLLEENESLRVDMVVRTMSITCARWEDVAFSTAYFDTGQQLLAPRDSGIDGFNASLEGARVCSSEKTTAEVLLTNDPRAEGATLVSAANHLDCLVLVQLGQADALMTDGALAAGHAAQDPQMHLVGSAESAESYGVAMHPDDVDLVRRVNQVLVDFAAGGPNSAWQQSYNRWLADHIEGATPPDPQYRD